MPVKRSAGAALPPNQGKPSQAKQLLRLFSDNYQLCRDEENEAFAIPVAGPNIAVPFAHIPRVLADLFNTEHRKPPSNNAVQEAKRTLEARIGRAPSTRLPLRLGWADEDCRTLLIDMGNAAGEVIEVKSSGWKIRPRSPLPFRRTEATRPMFDPREAEKGSVDGIRRLFNVNDHAWPFLVAWLVTAWVPDFDHIVLLLQGRYGVGKTTNARYLVELVDPSRGAHTGSYERPEDLMSHARGSLVIGLENVWKLPSGISDALSRLVTGSAQRKRKLYTNSDVHITQMRRTIVINGIEITGIKLDLRDRCIDIHLLPISDLSRKQRADCDGLFEKEGPAAVRYLLDTLAQAMRVARSGKYELSKKERMADAQQWLHYVDIVRGTDCAATYGENARTNTQEEAENDPVAMRLQELFASPEWRQRSKGVLMKSRGWVVSLGTRPEQVSLAEWPTSAKAFTGTMRQLEKGLRSAGWTVEEGMDHGSTNWLISAPSDAE